MQDQITLGYWNARGRAEPLRWLIRYLGEEFNEVNPTGAEWQAQKLQLRQEGMPFPGLPYIIDKDGWRLTESSAIPIYLARQYGNPDIFGKTIRDQARVMELLGVFGDIRTWVFKAIFTPEYKTTLADAAKDGSNVMTKLQYLFDFLGEKDFFLGYLTFFDFTFAYFLSLLLGTYKDAGVEINLTRFDAYVARVQATPAIKEYLATPAGQRQFFPAGYLPWDR